MKKFFLFAAALLVAASMNLQAAGDASVSVKRALVGSELKALKASYTNTAITSQYAIGAAATYKSGSAATVATDLYVNGAKVSGDHVIYPATEQAALTPNEWFGMQINVAAGATFTITDIIAQIAPGNAYSWDVKVRNAAGTDLYFSNAAFKVQSYNNAGNHAEDSIHFALDTVTSNAKTHASYQSVLDKAARIPANLTLTEGTYTVEIYYWGKASKALSLVELTVLGQAEGGEAYVAPTPVLPASLQNIVDSAKAIVDEPMYSQAKGNLAYAISEAESTLDYEANEAALRAAYAVAAASVEAYKPLVAELAIAQGKLASASAEAAGYATFESAVNKAKGIVENGTSNSPASEVITLIVAENAFVAAAGSAEAPADVTSFIVNPNFALGAEGWTVTVPNTQVVVTYTTGKYGFVGSLLAAQDTVVIKSSGNGQGKFQNFAVEQTITNIPNGDYYLSVDMFYDEHKGSDDSHNYGRDYFTLYANGKSAKCARPAGADQPANTKVKVRVSDNTLTIKVSSSANRNSDVGISNFKLEYANFDSWAKVNADSTGVTISSQEEFDDAIRLNAENFWKEGSDVVFTLNGGTYNLGTNVGRAFPKNHGNFILKAADGQKPVFNGSLRSSGARVNDLVLDGITFDGFANNTDNSPLHFAKGTADSIAGTIVIRNCSFDSIPACLIRINANNTEKYIHAILIENNTINGIGHHLFQFAGGKSFGVSSFTFRENLVMNMYATGGQFFNTPLSVNHPANDSIYTMTVENNVFYKIGGLASSARNFLEANKDNDWAEVYINVNNNIFWERYSDELYAESELALFNAKENQKVEVNFLNNLLSEVNVYANDALDEPDDMVSFHVSSGNIVPTYQHILADSLEGFEFATDMKMLQSYPLFTAGTDGTYVGKRSLYYDFSVAEGGNFIVDNVSALKQAMSYPEVGDTVVIELKNCVDEIGYYNLGASTRKIAAGKTLIVKAYGNNTPKVYGALIASSGSKKLDEILVENISFVGNGGSNESAAPLFTSSRDTFEIVTFKNCSFTELADPIARMRGGNAYIGTLTYEGCTIKDKLTGQHTFILNSGSHTLRNFVLKENVFDNYQGKQFMQFANMAQTSDSVLNVTVEHNTFHNFYNGAGSNATNFIEGAKVPYLNINVNNNFFAYDSIPADKGQPASINPGGSYKQLTVNLLNNFYTLEGTEIMNVKDGAIETEVDLYPEDVDLVGYKWGDKLYSTMPVYTAGTDGTYIGAQSMYKVFNFEMADNGVIVKNVAEFTDALVYADMSGMEDFTIYLKDCEDEGGIYLLNNNGRTFPTQIKNLTVTAAQDAKPQVCGSLKSSNGLKLDNYTIDGLTYVKANGAGTEFSPIYFNSKQDTVFNQLTIRNCQFLTLPASIMRTKGGFVKTILIENNLVDFTEHNLFQFDKSFTNVSFTFRENIVKNFAKHGQLFNTHIIANHPDNETVYNFTVEHNTFYKLGGAGTSMRNFLECTDANNWPEVYFNINNNIFWDRYSWDGYANAQIALFTATEDQKVEFNILKNVLAPENVLANDELNAPLDMQSFFIKEGTNIVPTMDNIIVDTLDTEFWADAANLKLWKESIYFTAGTDSTYIGALASYVKGASVPEDAIYYWESPEGVVVEKGGFAAHYSNDVLVTSGSRANYANDKYFSLCLNGKADYAEHIQIELDSALAEGDTIFVTAYRNKNADSKKANAKFKIGAAEFTDGTDGLYYTNICADEANADYDNDGNTPNTAAVAVPAEAYGEKSISITRGQTSTNLFITKLMIVRNPKAPEQPEAINAIEREATGVMYDIYGRKVSETVKGQIYIMDGQKFIEK